MEQLMYQLGFPAVVVLLILDKFVQFAKVKKANGLKFKCFAEHESESAVLMKQQIRDLHARKDKQGSEDRRQLTKSITAFTVTAEKLVVLLEKEK